MARLLAFALLCALPARAAVQVWVADESEKVRPSATGPAAGASARIRLTAAGGECAGAQIVVRSADGVRRLTASALPLRHGEKATVPLELSRVATIELTQPSGPEGSAGEWPDALIPVRDAIWNETRRAFPVDVGPGRAQAVFVEACAPRGAPGRYAGAVQVGWVRAKALVRTSVPVELRVRGFDLAATPELTTAFGFSGYSAAKGHGRPPGDGRELTTAWSDRLPSIDLWVPLLNCLDPRAPSCPRAAPRSSYDKLWWYQSCMSHGCGPLRPRDRDAFVGWPSYMIDAPATAARSMGWLAFANGISGELYFDVVHAYGLGDPWQSQWAFWGNGDGTLYYPGTPARIGGKHDVPVESLRVVQIQRGLQDHAYLALCARLGDPRLAKAEALAIAPSLRGWARDPRAYAAARERLAARIEALTAGPRGGALHLGRVA